MTSWIYYVRASDKSKRLSRLKVSNVAGVAYLFLRVLVTDAPSEARITLFALQQLLFWLSTVGSRLVLTTSHVITSYLPIAIELLNHVKQRIGFVDIVLNLCHSVILFSAVLATFIFCRDESLQVVSFVDLQRLAIIIPARKACIVTRALWKTSRVHVSAPCPFDSRFRYLPKK
jgi:hypothetical protein